MHAAHPALRREIVKGNVAIWELFFTAPHPTLVGLTKTDDGYSPIYDHIENTAEENRIINYIFDASMQFVQDFLDMPGVDMKTDLEYIEPVARKIMNNPNYHQAKYIGAYRIK